MPQTCKTRGAEPENETSEHILFVEFVSCLYLSSASSNALLILERIQPQVLFLDSPRAATALLSYLLSHSEVFLHAARQGWQSPRCGEDTNILSLFQGYLMWFCI